MFTWIVLLLFSTSPVALDNQWRPGDFAYSWPLEQHGIAVTYDHGAANPEPPGGPSTDDFGWFCDVDEAMNRAICRSLWEYAAESVCRSDRNLMPGERPYGGYVYWRGERSTVMRWRHVTLRGAGIVIPEWWLRPDYVWQFDRMQGIFASPSCTEIGCGWRAHLYIKEPGSLFVSEFSLNPQASAQPRLWGYPEEHIECRGLIVIGDLCAQNPNRPECNL